MRAIAKIGIVAMLGVGVAYGVRGWQISQIDDQKLIQESLQGAIQASKEGRPGGVLDKLSFKVSVNGTEYSSRESAIVDFIRKNRPDVSFENQRAAITQDEATIATPANVKLTVFGTSIDRTLKRVTLVFQRENEREWLFLPTHTWKLKEVRVPDDALGELTGFGL